MGRSLNEALFIYLGMNKEKWPCLTVETVQGFLDNPTPLDYDDKAFVECFHFYHEWYWDNERSK